jgi:2',3'-cyclic-nucleotide 2'-phosphodiesterase/3'-nucleotidase
MFITKNINNMKCKFNWLLLGITLCLTACTTPETKDISILETTDLHGVILPWDFIENEPLDASLAGTAGYVKELRSSENTVFLLDNGDNLQGQPAVYYYNYVDTTSPHIMSEAMNWMSYDACTMGNHDIEAGHSVYDRLVNEFNFPLLAANALDVESGEPYFKPYVILEKENIRVAVLGMVTPAISTWLPEELYSGIEFRDMVETAKLWMPEILKQKPDIVVGMFHSGWDIDNENYKLNDSLNENGTSSVAWKVPGFDIIFCGHDHRAANEKFINSEGDTILILNGGSRSQYIARADITVSSKGIFRKMKKNISGQLVRVNELEPDADFLASFSNQEKTINEYVTRVIGYLPEAITSRDSYFGSSAFTDMIHSIQLDITGADVSFAAPLSFDVTIAKGPVTVGDMFKIYRYENMLYTMSMTGEEIMKYLEYSYSEWLNTMDGPDDYLLKYRLGNNGEPVLTDGRAWLANASYNFDSGAGLEYIVDVSKPAGNRINIISFTDGRPFEKQKLYKAAINSYRGNGGGGHITKGAGIDHEELHERLISCTDRDLRYYILKTIEKNKTISPKPLNNWKIVPGKWVKNRIPEEKIFLFSKIK